MLRISTRRFCTQRSGDFFLETLSGKWAGVVLLCLNRPDTKNAISKAMLNGFYGALETVRRSKEFRVAIVKSTSKNAFCAGADLKERVNMPAAEVPGFVAKARSLMSELERLPIPIIAAIDGPALGGGLELSLACDLRVAANTAKLGLTETKLAIIPGAGGTQRLPRLIGSARAKELIYTGRIISGAEAEKLGVVNCCVEQNADGNAAYLKALALAEEILPNGPIGLAMAKEAIGRGLQMDLDSGLAIEKLCYDQVIPTKDRLEGLQAFKEKRKPVYRGE